MDIDAHAVADDLELVDQSDIDGAVEFFSGSLVISAARVQLTVTT